MNPARETTSRLSDYVGGLSNPSKMPGFAYGLPAADCQVGTRLRDIAGSTCSECYAYERGAYAWPVVKAAYKRRLRAIARKFWAPAMAELIRRKCSKHGVFRWHDSGDIQSVAHFADICRIAADTPEIRHWLPTREYRHVADYVGAGGIIPDNLNVRLSAHMIGGHVPTFPRLRGLVTVSTVSAGESPAGSWSCPAPAQNNACADCRACWSRDVAHVDYHLH